MKSMRKNDSLTWIQVIACVAVLMLHTNGCFWNFSATQMYWKSANIIECFFYFAVPLFFMSSGITMMDFYDRYTLREYFIKRGKKTVFPFLGWSCIGLFWGMARGQILVSDLNVSYVAKGIMDAAFVPMYWFFTPLFIIYLCMPLFAAVEKKKRRLVFTYLAVTGFILNSLIPFLLALCKVEWTMPYTLSVLSGSLFWPVAGWLIHNTEWTKRQRAGLYLLAILGLFMHIAGTYITSMEAGSIVRTFKGYQNVPCILYSVGIFVLLKQTGSRIMKKERVARFIGWLSRYTFAIYLEQFLLLDIIPMITGVDTKLLVYRLVAPFVMIPIMIGGTWLLRKVPGIRRLVP